MRYLVLSPDPRFVQELRQRGPDDVSFVEAGETAAAIRAWSAGRLDGAVLDTAAAPAVAREFLQWWTAAPERARLSLIVAGAGGAPASPGARRAERSVEEVSRAFAAAEPCVVVVQERLLQGPAGVVSLTASETALLAHLARRAAPVPAAELLREALGYEDERSLAVVRTHLANVRHKCRAAGLPLRVGSVRGVGYYAQGLAVRP